MARRKDHGDVRHGMRMSPKRSAGPAEQRPRVLAGPVPEETFRAAAGGDREAARQVLRAHARAKGWSPETLRVRLDGAFALQDWARGAGLRRVDGITREQVARFRDHLLARGLAWATVRTYLKGAKDLYVALFRLRGALPPLDVPFHRLPARPERNVGTPGVPGAPPGDGDGRLRLLRELVHHGLSAAECTRLTWRDVDVHAGVVTVECRGRQLRVPLSPVAREALLALPVRDGPWVGWSADHARRMLKRYRAR